MYRFVFFLQFIRQLVVVLLTQLCLTLCDSVHCGYSSGKNAGVGSHSLLQGIFPTQGWNLGLVHCRQRGKQIEKTLNGMNAPRNPVLPKGLQWTPGPLQRGLLCFLLENGKLGSSTRVGKVRPGSGGSWALASRSSGTSALASP